MNGTNGNEPGYPENALVPYPVIVAATKGDPDAMKIVLQHFSGYIARLSMMKKPLNLHRSGLPPGNARQRLMKLTCFPGCSFAGTAATKCMQYAEPGRLNGNTPTLAATTATGQEMICSALRIISAKAY